MTKQEENVLLLCLSPVPANAIKNNYIYYDGKDPIKITGRMTNEAPLQIVLKLLKKQSKNLDRIVALYLIDPTFLLDDGSCDRQSKEPENVTYYRELVKNYAENYKMDIPQIITVATNKNPEEYDIAEVAVEAADKILGENSLVKTDIHLYIDYNGGLRFVASMLLNTANLLEQRGVKIEGILTSNFDNKVHLEDSKEYVSVQNLMAILQSSRLVSGIKEYLDYGRCGELKRYFDGCDDQKIKEILRDMEQLSYELEMCDTDKIFGKGTKDKLKKELEDYSIKDTNDAYGVLFNYIAKDILTGYEPFFSGDLLDIIDWCREKDYLQQAVTFYYERMPSYFWESGIYKPTEEEENEYKQIKLVCECINKFDVGWRTLTGSERLDKFKNKLDELNENSTDGHLVEIIQHIKSNITSHQLGTIRNHYLKYDWKASWSQKYLKYSYNPEANENNEYRWMNATQRPRRVQTVQDIVDKFTEYNQRYINDPNIDIIEEAREFLKDFLDNFLVEDRIISCNANSKTDNESDDEVMKRCDLMEILLEYQYIKEQRNMVNHADDNENHVSNRWPHDVMLQNLKSDIDHIRKFKNKEDSGIRGNYNQKIDDRIDAIVNSLLSVNDC